MAVDEIDLDGMSNDEIDAGGGSVPPGHYHVIVTKVAEDPKAKNHPVRILELTILAGTSPMMKNKKHFERLHITENSKMNIARWAKVLGLIDAAQVKAGGKATIDWSRAKNKHCVVKIVPQKDKNTGQLNGYMQCEYMGVYSVDDERVKHVPKDTRALTRDGIDLPAADGNGKQPPPPPSNGEIAERL